ncbi:MAG: ribosome maturation factor RimM [Alphaproteobacteria bacterium]|nr:ribosome maturation factor RimM [Alphaproteobacteria bacterium]
MTTKNTPQKICVGQFAGAHGVRGLIKLRSFTAQPEAIFTYAPLSDQEGARTFTLALKSAAKDHFIVSVEGINDKESADRLRGDRLYIPHDALPKPAEGEYYEADLIGLRATDKNGKDHGQVMGVYDHGAGVFLEIGTSKKDSFMLPFRDAFVPEVDLGQSKLVIVVPEGLL